MAGRGQIRPHRGGPVTASLSVRALVPCCSARLPWHNSSLVPPPPPQGKGVRVTGEEGKSEPRGKARHHAIKCSAKGAWQEATLA